MDNFTLAELGVFLGVLGGILTSIMLTIQKSKCKTINCCGMKCERETKLNRDGPTPPAANSHPPKDPTTGGTPSAPLEAPHSAP